MKLHPRTDANQAAIVKALRACGCTVVSLAMVGSGTPDLLVGYKNETYLMECKNGEKPPSERKLTYQQREWIGTWRGRPVVVVTSVDDAVRAVGALGLK